MELLKVDDVDKAAEMLLEYASGWELVCEDVPLEQCLGRVLYRDLYAMENIPAFCRSTVDGYAVVSKDTAAAGESVPVFLTLKGCVQMGRDAGIAIKSGECTEIPTGGMLSNGADAVVMLEYCEHFGKDGVVIGKSAAYGENTVSAGSDCRSGALLLKHGKRLLPQDIGALAAAGMTSVPVYAPLRLAIISTGDELVPPYTTPALGQVRDINTYALKAMAEKNGFAVVSTAVLTDDETELENAVRSAMSKSDIVVVSGGSSQGKKDATQKIISKVSEPGVFTHGLAVKPGKPTILGYDSEAKTLLAGLPGHPVSAMMVFELLFCRLLRELTGCARPPAIPATLACNVASSPGKLTCWPAVLEPSGCEYTATPVFGKSGLITTLTKADGYFTAARGAEGIKAGEIVMVHLF